MKPIVIITIAFVCSVVTVGLLLTQTIQTDISSQECSGTASCITGTVTQVIDGDTLKVDGQSIRFALASAPEMNEFGGDTSREFIQEICPVGSTALVDEDDMQTKGSYGRIIGVIFCNDLNLNEELVDSGLGDLTISFCNTSEFSNDMWAQKHGC
jgi:micrococcal nuclease